MSKKAVVILSILAIILAGVSGGLFYLINDKVANAVASLKPIDEFKSKTINADEHPLEARLPSGAGAAAELHKVRDDNAAKQADIESKATKIAGLERNVREKEASIQDLEGKNTQLTRERDEVQTKVASLTSDLNASKTKADELETTVAKQAEDFQKRVDELEKKVAADKTELYAEIENTRKFYAQNYNYATSRGLSLPLPAEPWNGQQKSTGPEFAPRTFVAQIIGFDARQGLVVVNVGPESGLLRDQTFELFIAGKSVGRVSVSASPTGSVSALNFVGDAPVPTLAIGTPVKLQAFVGEPAKVAAPAASADKK